MTRRHNLRDGLPQFARPGATVKNGVKLFDLSSELSEASILAALPVDHSCQEIRLINIDGKAKGAALVFKPANPATRSPVRLAPLPGIALRGTDLKIVGKSDAILEALDTANRIATSRLPILIQGQTGVGKELFARLIHSHLPPQLFAAINCGAVSVAAIDAALQGAMSAVCSPTLVLDEIGELPPSIQPFLLAKGRLERRGRAHQLLNGSDALKLQRHRRCLQGTRHSCHGACRSLRSRHRKPPNW